MKHQWNTSFAPINLEDKEEEVVKGWRKEGDNEDFCILLLVLTLIDTASSGKKFHHVYQDLRFISSYLAIRFKVVFS